MHSGGRADGGEGVETGDELAWLAGEGVRLFQGYLFARPGFECLPAAHYPPAISAPR